MEVPLSPLEFARRTRRLYAGQEAVVDEDLRLTYAEFFDRCDRWSSALQEMGVRQGDRVATIAPNTHAQLEQFYAVPQIGAVLVPINYQKSTRVQQTADALYQQFKDAGIDVLLDDRDARPGVKFADSELMGIPHRIVIGDRGLDAGNLEYRHRRATESTEIPAADPVG